MEINCTRLDKDQSPGMLSDYSLFVTCMLKAPLHSVQALAASEMDGNSNLRSGTTIGGRSQYQMLIRSVTKRLLHLPGVKVIIPPAMALPSG